MALMIRLNKKKFQLKSQNRLSILALIVSILSLIWTIAWSIISSQFSSAPNIIFQGLNSYDYVQAEKNQTPSFQKYYERITVHTDIELKNVGIIPTEIIQVNWKPIDIGQEVNTKDNWLAIGDMKKPSDTGDKGFYNVKNNPVLGIQNPVIKAGETKQLHIAYYGSSVLAKNGYQGYWPLNVQVILTFSNGQKLTINSNANPYSFNITLGSCLINRGCK